MAGMILGITVRGPGEPSAVERHTPATETPRKLTMVMRPGIASEGHVRPAGFVLSEGTTPPASDHVGMPGPTLVLRRDEPVEITLVNRLSEATAIHWHGMELDSYYDGSMGGAVTVSTWRR
ncbi:MAG: multicopper oxidase domain-containing protein [Chromatiales bacterium]